MATRRVSRPAQGNNSSAPLNRPRPAYRPQPGPKVVGSGSLSKPADTLWAKGTLATLPQDAAPTIVKL